MNTYSILHTRSVRWLDLVAAENAFSNAGIETKKAWQMFAAGIATRLLGFAVVFIKQKHATSLIGQGIESWYGFGGLQYSGRSRIEGYGQPHGEWHVILFFALSEIAAK